MAVGSGVWVGVGWGVAVGSGVCVGVGSGVAVGSGVWVGVGWGVAVGSGVCVGVGSGVAVGSGVWVGVGWGVAVGSGVCVGVGSGVAVGSGVCVGMFARSITIPNWSPTMGGSVVGNMENMPAGAVGVSATPTGVSPQAEAISRTNAPNANLKKCPDMRCPTSTFPNDSFPLSYSPAATLHPSINKCLLRTTVTHIPGILLLESLLNFVELHLSSL